MGLRWAWVATAIAGALLLAPATAGGQAGREAHSIELTGTIDPATEAWVDRALRDAAADGARLAIVRLDTPGGLDTSMRAIVKDIIAAPMPVVVHVAPNGARAASAGLFVTLAADVAAMAPQTNIGSATPVQIGPGPRDEVLGRKIENDAAAYVRALAEGHGRNAGLAERMVRGAENVTARRALRERLIEVVATDEHELLRRLDGRTIRGPKSRRVDTTGLAVERRDMPFRYEAQQFLVNPTVALLLLLLGLAGIALELMSPGAVAPGGLGAVALLLGLYGSAQLPVTLVGVVLLALAIGLFVAEAHIASHGALAVAGVAALVAGGVLLFDTDSEAFRVSVPVAVATGAALGSLTLLAVSKALAARRGPVRGSVEELVGEVASVRAALDPVGQVFVAGALWRARLPDPAARADVGERVVVRSVDGLTLEVRPIEDTEGVETAEGSVR